jgi:hypothetical protein
LYKCAVVERSFKNTQMKRLYSELNKKCSFDSCVKIKHNEQKDTIMKDVLHTDAKQDDANIQNVVVTSAQCGSHEQEKTTEITDCDVTAKTIINSNKHSQENNTSIVTTTDTSTTTTTNIGTINTSIITSINTITNTHEMTKQYPLLPITAEKRKQLLLLHKLKLPQDIVYEIYTFTPIEPIQIVDHTLPIHFKNVSSVYNLTTLMKQYGTICNTYIVDLLNKGYVYGRDAQVYYNMDLPSNGHWVIHCDATIFLQLILHKQYYSSNINIGII